MIPVNRIFPGKNPEEEIAMLAAEGPLFRAVEIGFGNGEFLEHAARVRPEGLFFGIEVSLQCVMKAVRRIQRSCCPNVRILFGDARFILGCCFPPEWLDAVYMNFPCPWPKTRHAKRRVTHSGFTDVLAGSLVTGGVFELVTDDGTYADEVSRVISVHSALDLEERSLNPERDISTKYERKWLEQGKDIHLLRFRKKIPFFSVKPEKEESKLHSALEVKCPSLSKINTLSDREGGEPSNRWVFKESFESVSRVILLETITSDDGFRQSFFIRIIPRAEGCLVKIDAPSRPFRTPAVLAAFGFLVDFIRSDIE